MSSRLHTVVRGGVTYKVRLSDEIAKALGLSVNEEETKAKDAKADKA